MSEEAGGHGSRGDRLRATEAPVYRDSSRFWELLNPEVAQVICRACHEAKSAAENRSETRERAAWRERLEGMA